MLLQRLNRRVDRQVCNLNTTNKTFGTVPETDKGRVYFRSHLTKPTNDARQPRQIIMCLPGSV